jgi:pyruvate/2-oxoglutarate/acetoin dehydrogenase E1 component
MPDKFYWEALRDGMRDEMIRDESVFIMGEDVGIYGGAYGATRALYEEFGEKRVRDTAISEAAIAGAACGAALVGMRPVAEIMFIDFATIAADQIVNQAAKMHYMFGGKMSVPMVVRTEGGAGKGISAHHSQSLEAWYVHMPGLFVVMPSTPYDAKGLLKTAIREDNPVMFIEHKLLYGTRGEVPEEEYTLPLGKADVKREGGDVTIVTYSKMVLESLTAADMLAQKGIEAEVLDLRSLKPLDMEAILKSVKKTGNVLLVSEGYSNVNFMCEVAMRIMEQAFDFLDAPIGRLCSADVPVPMSPVLEAAAIPDAERIAARAVAVLEGRG